MRILFLARSLETGGAERQLTAAATGLADRGHEVAVAVFYSGGELETDLGSVQVIDLAKRSRWDVLGFLWRLKRAVREFGPDVLHGYLGTPNLLTVLLKPFFRKSKMVWGVRAATMHLSQYGFLVVLHYWVERHLARFADRILVNSEAGAEYAGRHGFPRRKMRVVENGIDTDRFRPDPDGRERLRGAWGVGDGEKLVGVVGRLDHMKDHPTFLRAAALAGDERADLRFVCVGPGPDDYRAELETLAADLGIGERVRFTGPCEDMPAAYSALDALCLSSIGEGFPNVVAEAMACAVPCVVTEAGDAPRIVGETGETTPIGDPDKLAAALLTLAERTASDTELGVSCRERVVEHFSLQLMVARTETALAELTGEV